MSQQPVYEAYPNYVIKKPDSSHSNGQYGPVFIVLAVIVVISAVACAFGRFCNRQHHRVHKEAHHHVKAANYVAERPRVEAEKQNPSLGPREWEKQNPSLGPKEWEKQNPSPGPREWESTQRPVFKLRERGDGELGFDKRAGMPNNGGGMVGPPPHYNSGIKPQVRFAGNV